MCLRTALYLILVSKPTVKAFQSGPDAKNRPALKGSSANQIASFSLIKNKLYNEHETLYAIYGQPNEGRPKSQFYAAKQCLQGSLRYLSAITASTKESANVIEIEKRRFELITCQR